MKTHLQKTGKRFLSGVFFGLLFILIGPLLNWGIDNVESMYYQRSPLENFFQAEFMTANEMCLGDREQEFHSVRHVSSENGWRADIVRELFQKENGIVFKIYEEKATVNIEPRKNGESYRVEQYDFDLKEGMYQWQISVNRLYLPNDVTRTDAPIIKTNWFKVKPCHD